jgi:peroxiredoxin
MKRGLILAAAALVALSACSDGQVQRSNDGNQQGYISGSGSVTIVEKEDREPVPDFSRPLLDGGEFTLAEAVGDVVVLNIWGSWCPPCRKEAPELQAVYEAVKDQGVQFIGINIRDTEVAARNYEDEFGITYPSVFDPKSEVVLETFRETLPPNAIPSTLIIDRDGLLAVRIMGPISEGSLRAMVDDVLAETEPAGAS